MHGIDYLAWGLVTAASIFACPTIGAAQCADTTGGGTDFGAWPGGKIYYEMDPTLLIPNDVRAAMDTWEDVSSNMIEFIPATSGTRLKIVNCMVDAAGKSSGESQGYNGAMNGHPETYLCPGNLAHELGHAIGLRHQFARSDRSHYIQVKPGLCEAKAPSDDADFGPYNYQSVMSYVATDKDQKRWDGTDICTVIGPAGECNEGVTGPFVSIKTGDGGGVLELYGKGLGWSKFRRTFYSTIETQPYLDNDGMRDTLLAQDASPAVESWNAGSPAVYARRADNVIIKKFLNTPSAVWSEWSQIGALPTNDVSDPAVVSWAPGRTDLTVRAGSEVFITSTPTWGTWDSLGSPAGGAASAPAITSLGENHLLVLVRATDNRIYTRECTAACSGASGTWGAWEPIGTETFIGKPAAVARGNVIDVVAHANDDHLWLVDKTPTGWMQWGDMGLRMILSRQGCDDCGSPAIGATSENQLNIYVRGQDDHIWLFNWSSNGDETMIGLGGNVQTSPATVTTATPGRAELFVSMQEEFSLGAYAQGIWRKSSGN